MDVVKSKSYTVTKFHKQKLGNDCQNIKNHDDYLNEFIINN
jgi:hypothetical protein